MADGEGDGLAADTRVDAISDYCCSTLKVSSLIVAYSQTRTGTLWDISRVNVNCCLFLLCGTLAELAKTS